MKEKSDVVNSNDFLKKHQAQFLTFINPSAFTLEPYSILYCKVEKRESEIRMSIYKELARNSLIGIKNEEIKSVETKKTKDFSVCSSIPLRCLVFLDS